MSAIRRGFSLILMAKCFSALLWKGGRTWLRVFAIALLLGICSGDWVIWDTIKHAVARPRPFHQLSDARLIIGMGDSYSMPSSHSANWFAATVITFIFYRRSIWFMLPIASTVAFSRMHNGVHYPSDVLTGAILGAGYGATLVWTAEKLLALGWAAMVSSLVGALYRPKNRKSSRAIVTRSTLAAARLYFSCDSFSWPPGVSGRGQN